MTMRNGFLILRNEDNSVLRQFSIVYMYIHIICVILS